VAGRATERCPPAGAEEAPGSGGAEVEGMGVQPGRGGAVLLGVCVHDTRSGTASRAPTSRTAGPRSPPRGLAGSQTGFALDDRTAYGGVRLRNQESVGSKTSRAASRPTSTAK